jgi:hypothetical protein
MLSLVNKPLHMDSNIPSFINDNYNVQRNVCKLIQYKMKTFTHHILVFLWFWGPIKQAIISN